MSPEQIVANRILAARGVARKSRSYVARACGWDPKKQTRIEESGRVLVGDLWLIARTLGVGPVDLLPDDLDVISQGDDDGTEEGDDD